MNLDELGRFLSFVGIPAGFAFGLLLLIWKVLRAIAPYGRDAYQKHASLVATLEDALKEQVRNTELQLDQLDRLADRTESTVVLRKVAMSAVQVLEKIARRLEIDVAQEIDSMRRHLES